ncbi:MAG TPA: acyl-CoA dehydrogenase family protein, partial [Candidatus Binataceae bacterium]|nr:acyl-CoA dehydrogenase family protein [Candidatus Binataceae bacterium]
RSAFEEEPGGSDHADPALKSAKSQWRESLRKKGWLAPAWPQKFGGGGLGPAHQFILIDEFIKHNAPRFFDMGLGMIGPTIISHGREEQKERMLPPILSGEDEWCELFSEPAAGSDLAGLKCRAVKDGDEYVVNGQKIWTTYANRANWGLLMARTDAEAPRHKGISMLRVNMKAPGVTVRLINNLTNHEFNEVFFEDVRVPATDLIGEENRGFYYLMSLLDTERSAVSQVASIEKTLESLFKLARSETLPPLSKAAKAELVNRAIEVEVLRGLSQGVAELQFKGRPPVHQASVLKLYHTELAQRIASTGMKMIETHGLLWRGEGRAPLDGMIAQQYLYASTLTLQVGTSEIQRNIIATRGLGLQRG